MMKIRNDLLKAVIAFVSFLPFGLLYILSDFLSFVLMYVVRYRRDTVQRNLSRSFPEKNAKELNQITRKYYRNLSDLIVEILKLSRMTRRQIDQRVEFRNQEIFDDLYDKKINVFAVLGHCGNWEWVGNKFALFLKHEGGAVFKPVHDQFFNDFLITQRQKIRANLMIDYKKVSRSLIALKDRLFTIFILADQSPARTEQNYFVHFLNQPTAFYLGMEKIARALHYAVVYLDIQRVERGFYQVDVIPITFDASKTKEEEVTKKYINLLENTIRRNPDNWLWSHRRWKNLEEEKIT